MRCPDEYQYPFPPEPEDIATDLLDTLKMGVILLIGLYVLLFFG